MDPIHPRQRYAHCDSYFVESDEISMAERIRERERQISKIRQRELANELSSLTSDEYLEDILDHMEHMESITMPDVSSIDTQHEIQWYMRPYLLDFLVEAHGAFQLLPETLYLTINLLDRYCSRRVVFKRHYQLVGCAALLIAAKYGDKKERVPTFRELRGMCCQLYEEEMFMQMEWHVLQTLDYMLGHPTVDSFLQIALEECASDDTELQHMSWYMCELALYHKDFVDVRPSILARSSLALARCILGRDQISSDLWAGRYDSNVILALVNCLSQPSQILARKFSTQKMSTAAQNVEQFLQTQQQGYGNSMQVDNTPDSGYGTPSTPHKYNAPIVQYGCMTPPITPQGDSSISLDYGKHQTFPATPSPVPSDHHLTIEQGMDQNYYGASNYSQSRPVQ